jgi:tRNA(Ile2) C34 agmatinyltransferase TiaS
MMSDRERRAEEILLAVFSEIVFKGNIVRQESPRCCGMTIDHIAGAMNVNFREIKIGEKIVNLLEPICPECGRRVKAVYSVMQ